MSQHLAELSSLLVKQIHGDLPHLIYATLLKHGRLQLRSLVRLTSLAPLYVKNGLAVLVTHKLITFHPAGPADETFYEADQVQAYNLVRLGQAPELIQYRYGPQASEIAAASQYLGLASSSQLAEEAFKHSHGGTDRGKLANGVNGQAKTLSEDASDHEKTAKWLHELGFLETARDLSFMSAVDLELAVADWVRLNDARFAKGTTGPKKGKEFREAIDVKKGRLKRGIDSLDNEMAPSEIQNSREESPDVQEKPRKKRKTNILANGASTQKSENTVGGHADRGSRQSSPKLDDEASKNDKKSAVEAASPRGNATFLYFCQPRFVQARLSQVLSQHVERCLGDSASHVYSALLQTLEQISRDDMNSNRRDDGDDKLVVADTSQVFEALDVSIRAAILKEADARDEIERKETIVIDYDDDEPRHTSVPTKSSHLHKKPPINGVHSHKHRSELEKLELLKQAVSTQLHVLADDPHEFVHYDKHFKKWSVDHERLTKDLIQFELERTINARFGPTATRMTRILRDQGKLEEKQIGQYGLVQQKELRSVLASMQEAGYVEVQEVPRDNSRQPSRNIYLWSYNQEHTRTTVLERVYKTMSRLLQRSEHEKAKVAEAIEKTERTDFTDRKEELLKKVEKDALAAWAAKDEKIWLQLSRLDDLVLLFRDSLESMRP